MLINPNRPVSDFAGLRESFTTYEGDTIEGTTEVDSHGRLIIRFADGTWAFSPIQYDTTATPGAGR